MSTQNNIDEVAEPLSKGEKAFKALHAVALNKKIVPGVTDQEHVFKGQERKLDQPTASLEIYKSEDESKENYDKGLKTSDESVEEATLSAKAARAGKDIGAPGKNFAKIAKDAAKRYGSKAAGERVAGAVLAKMRAHEEVEQTDEGLSKNWDSAHTKDKDLQHTKPSMKNYRRPGEEMRSALSKMAADKVGEFLAKGGKIKKIKEEEELEEKTLTPAETKKREEVAKAISRENPDMPMAKKMAIATATAKKVAEDVDYDYEGEMAKAELRAVCDKAEKLANMLTDDQQLEAWLQSKISKAKDYIDAVYDYMMYREKPTVAAPQAMPTQSDTMAGTYGSFLNRMGEETEMSEETVDEAMGTMASIKAGAKKGYEDSRRAQLAAMAHPKDQITKKDVLVARGVLTPDGKKVKEENEYIELKSKALANAFEKMDFISGKNKPAHTNNLGSSKTKQGIGSNSSVHNADTQSHTNVKSGSTQTKQGIGSDSSVHDKVVNTKPAPRRGDLIGGRNQSPQPRRGDLIGGPNRAQPPKYTK
jgi:hypothetical protein